MAGDAHGHDDWFRHDAADGVPQAEHAAHVSPAALGIAFIAITFGVLGLVLILVLYFNSYTTTLKAERQEGTRSAEQYLVYRSGAESRLSQASWVDRQAGVVRIPIDRAMELVAEEYVADQTAAAE